jgi:hypothetical protein
MSAKKVLSLKIAKQFLADNDSVRLGGYTSIEADAAAVLAKFKGGLDLSGLRSLDVAAARALSKHCEDLGLFGLKKLSDELAQALSKHTGPLGLSGLESLSDRAAQHLSKHKALYLSGLLKLSPQAAACLAKNYDTVFPFILRPEAAAGVLEVRGERHGGKRPAIRSKKLKALQIVLPVKKRPVHLIQKQSKLLKSLKSHIAELQHQSETARDRTALESLKSRLESSPGPCASFHFPLPESAADSAADGDWEESCNSLQEWAARELNALNTCFVDVENLTESCNECIGFTSFVFRHRRYVKEDEMIADDGSLQWRCIGNEITVMMTDQTDQYELPPHELSDLFNRALPPDRTMVYFDMGANGLYVLMETKGMESRLSKVLVGKAASSARRKTNKAPDPEPDGECDSEAPEALSWLTAATAVDPKIETFKRSVEDIGSEQALCRMIVEGKGARLGVDQLSVKDAELLASFPGEVLEIRVRGPISDEAATALAGFQGNQLELSGVSDLSEAALKTLLSPKRSYLAILSSAPSSSPEDKRTIAVDFPLSEACLKKLPAFKSDRLFLNGIANLSDAGAKSLASFKGELLCLDGITDLSEAAATALAACRCQQLRLDGLKNLSPAVAAALARSRCDSLHLNGVQSISDSAALALSAFKASEKEAYTTFELSINGIGTLSDAAAKALAKTKVFTLSLGGLKKISDLGLSNLVQFDGSLKVGFEHISDAAAKSLGKNRRNALHLDALSEISELAITEIAPSIDHTLSLCGFRKLSVAAAQVLATCSCTVKRYPTDYGFLYLDGLRTLSVAIAEELAKTTAALHLNGVTSLGEAEARALAKHQGVLQLNGVTSLTDRAVEALAKHVGDLNLCGLETMSDTAAAHLANHEGDLGLSGLQSLSDTAARYLSKHEGRIWPSPSEPIWQQICEYF